MPKALDQMYANALASLRRGRSVAFDEVIRFAIQNIRQCKV
jgi:hypothetical protein